MESNAESEDDCEKIERKTKTLRNHKTPPPTTKLMYNKLAKLHLLHEFKNHE